MPATTLTLPLTSHERSLVPDLVLEFCVAEDRHHAEAGWDPSAPILYIQPCCKADELVSMPVPPGADGGTLGWLERVARMVGANPPRDPSRAVAMMLNPATTASDTTKERVLIGILPGEDGVFTLHRRAGRERLLTLRPDATELTSAEAQLVGPLTALLRASAP